MKPTTSTSAVRPHRRPPSRLWSRLGKPGKRYRLPANVTGEDDWEVDVPQIRMSRAFGVMLVLHLVAVGGLFAFHMFGRDEHAGDKLTALESEREAAAPLPSAVPAPVTPAMASRPAVPAAAPEIPAAPLRNTAPLQARSGEGTDIPKARAVPEDEVSTGPRGYIQHTLKKGDSRELLASTYQISVRELVAANPRATFAAGTAVNIPQPQKVITAVDPGELPREDPGLLEPVPQEGITRVNFTPQGGGPEEQVQASQVTLRPPAAGVNRNEVTDRNEVPAPPVNRSHASPAPLKTKSPAASLAEQRAPARKAGTEPVAKKEPAPASQAVKSSAGSRSHVVQKGDTVYNVARHYSLSVNDVMRLNNITDAGKLQLGQVLKIPVRR